LFIRHLEQIDLRHGPGDIQKRIDAPESSQSLIDHRLRHRRLRQIVCDDQHLGAGRLHGFGGFLKMGALRATKASAEKSRARRMAVALPIPWLAPVTMATESDMEVSRIGRCVRRAPGNVTRCAASCGPCRNAFEQRPQTVGHG
jgi:hypothetical protein